MDSESNEEILLTAMDNAEELEETGWDVGEMECGDTFKMVPETKLTEKQLVVFLVVDEKARELFAFTYDDLGECTVGEHSVRTISDKPIAYQPTRVPHRIRELLKRETEKMLKARVIQISTSPYSFRVVVVMKKDGTIRICVDYRPLNAITLQEQWPLPRIFDILEKLARSKWFTIIDLKSGYWQIKMAKDSIHKVAFSTPDGHYEFLRLPFGLKNAPAQFCRIMKEILGDLDFVEVYIDDIIVHSKTFDWHVEHCLKVLERLKNANMRINPEKCKWFAQEIKILGHVISFEKINMDPEKIKAIIDMKAPQNVKQLQRFIGLVNFYRSFIMNMSKIAGPLYGLLTKDTPWIWDKACQDAFENLKKALTTKPILRPPDFNRMFIIYTDASGFAIGVILAQKDDDNIEYVVLYASRQMKGAEIHYGTTEKECLAIIYGLKVCEHYVLGSQFEIVTDHMALKWMLSMKNPTGRLARWIIFFQKFDCKIIYRPGKEHGNVDCLSRPVLAALVANLFEEKEDESKKILDPLNDECLLHYLKYARHVRGASNKQVKRVENQARKYKLIDNKLYYIRKGDQKSLLIPPILERAEIVEKAHNLGHFQAASTYDRIKDDYYWRNMFEDVLQIVKQCTTCMRHQKVIGKNHPAQALSVDGIFDRVGIDLVLGLPETERGNKGLLVMTEYLTKYVFVAPIKSKEAKEIADHVLSFISIFGPPKIILSDQGLEFNNSLVDSILNAVETEHRVTSGYNPRTNGLTERMNQTLIESLRKHAEMDVNNWDLHVPYIRLSYNSRIHTTTKTSPFELLFGEKMNKFEDWSNLPLQQSETEALNKRYLEIQKLIEDRQTAIAKIKDKQVIQKAIQDKQHTTTEETLEPGTKVYVKREGMLGKFEPRYEGPYTVIRQTSKGNYELQDCLDESAKKTYPLHKLKIVEDVSRETEKNVEIDRILDHRRAKKGFDYLVKWKDGSEDSWVHESDFNTVEIINEYKKMIKSQNVRGKSHQVEQMPKQTERRGRGRPRKNLTSNLLNSALTLLLIFCFFAPTNAIKIASNFMFCDTNNPDRLVDLNTLCTPETKISWNQPENDWNFPSNGSLLFVYTKLHNLVNGEGYQCRKNKITRTYTMTFLGEKHVDYKNNRVPLTAEDCWEMVRTRKCNNLPMDCNGKSCHLDEEPVEKYEWWRTVIIENFTCEFTARIIEAEKTDDPIFTQKCRPIDLWCLLKDSTIVWTNDIIHDCPFKFIYMHVFFNLFDNVLVDSDNHLALQVTHEETLCGETLCNRRRPLYSTGKIGECNNDWNE